MVTASDAAVAPAAARPATPRSRAASRVDSSCIPTHSDSSSEPDPEPLPCASPPPRACTLKALEIDDPQMIEVPSEGPATSRSIPSARSHSSYPHVKLLSERGQGASLASGIATLSNTNVGVAVLALPAAFANAGGIGGVLMLLAAGAAAIFSARLLSDCVDVVGRPATLASVAKAALGPWSIVSDLAIIVGASGCAIGYLIVVGDTVPHVVGFTLGIYNSSRLIYILLSMLIVVPLAHLRRIDSLKYASFFVIVCSAYVMVLMALYVLQPAVFGGAPKAECLGPVDATSDTWHTLVAMPTFAFSYAWQAQAVPIASELSEPTPKRVTRVFIGAWGVVTAIFTVVGLGGYLSFGRYVKGDLLLCYPDTAEVATIRLAFAMIVIFSHPVVSYPVSSSVDALLGLCGGVCCRGSRPPIGQPAEDASSDALFVTDTRRRRIIGVYLALTLAVALSVEDLGIIISLSGAIASALLVFIVPGACYLSLVRKGTTLFRGLSLICLVTGVILLPVLAYIVVREAWLESGGESAMRDARAAARAMSNETTQNGTLGTL